MLFSSAPHLLGYLVGMLFSECLGCQKPNLWIRPCYSRPVLGATVTHNLVLCAGLELLLHTLHFAK